MITLRSAHVSVDGPDDPDVVWERYAAPDLWPTWAPQITAVDYPLPRIAPGVGGTVHGLAGVRVKFTITQVDEPRRLWAWRVRIGPLRMHLDHTVSAGPRGGTTTALTVDGPPVLVHAYALASTIALRRLVGLSNG